MKLYKHKVQYYETDQMGVVHHSNYLRWFDEARLDLMEQVGIDWLEMEKQGIHVPVLAVEADYLRMVRMGDSVIIRAYITEYNGIKLTVNYRVTDKETGNVYCKGITKHCFLNQKGRPISLKRSFADIHKIFEKELARGIKVEAKMKEKAKKSKAES